MTVSPAPPRGAVLVTGMPRSGTTWLARLLATAPGTGLAGREPMNPRGRQYALGGTLTGWTVLDEPTARQRWALWTAYRGINPWVLSRYGRRRWAATLPWTRVVIKDPFALLSVPTVTRVTGATPVILFRHPGASLVSYRRMGWTPDLDEVAPLLAAHRAARGDAVGPDLRSVAGDEVAAMAGFWSALYEVALDRADERAVWVSHERLAAGGPPEARRLFARLGLEWSAESEREFGEVGNRPPTAGSAPGGAEAGPAPKAPAAEQLHQFDRAPDQVAQEWRTRLTADELARIEELTAPVAERLGARLAG